VPAGRDEVEEIPADGDEREDDQRPAPPQPVRQPTAGISVDGVQQVPQRAVERHRPHARPQELQVLGDEAHPQLLAHPQDEEGEEDRAEIALQSEERTETGEGGGGRAN
jgi:hypothetical protein